MDMIGDDTQYRFITSPPRARCLGLGLSLFLHIMFKYLTLLTCGRSPITSVFPFFFENRMRVPVSRLPSRMTTLVPFIDSTLSYDRLSDAQKA